MSTRSIALARERRNILANELNNDWGDHLDGHFSAFWERINADHEQADPVARARIERAVQKLGPTIEALTERL